MPRRNELRDSDESVDATRAAAFRAMIESLIKARAPAHTQFRERYTMLLQ